MAAAAIAASVHVAYLATPLHVDEAGLAMVGRSALSGAGNLLYGSMWIDRPPLLVWLYGSAELMLGSLGIRLLGMIAAVALVMSVAWSVRRIVGAPWETVGAILAAPLACSPALSANLTYAELLAAPLVCLCGGLVVPALAVSDHTLRNRTWLAAGAAASTALLLKQSFIDGLALGGIAVMVATPIRGLPQRLASFGAGVCIPVVIVIGAAHATGSSLSSLGYAIAGFRMDAADVLASNAISTSTRAIRMSAGLGASGYLLLIPLTGIGLATSMRHHPRQAACLATWLAASWAGVLGGGYFWTHYMIGAAPVMAVLSTLGMRTLITRTRRTKPHRIHAMLIGSFLAMHAAGVLASMHLTGGQQQEPAVAAGRFVRDRAGPNDTVYVLYARANAAYYAHITPAFPYQWSLMYRTIPNMDHQVSRMLRGCHAPTWIIAWDHPTYYGMDRSGAIRKLVSDRYMRVGTPHGVPILRAIAPHRCT